MLTCAHKISLLKPLNPQFPRAREILFFCKFSNQKDLRQFYYLTSIEIKVYGR